MLERLPKPELWEQLVAIFGVVVLLVLTWFIARKVGKWLEGSTRLGMRGLKRMAAPTTVLLWLLVGWLTLEGTQRATPNLEWLIEFLAIAAVFWFASRALDVAWATGSASARLRAQPAATAAVLATKHLGKFLLLALGAAALAVKLGATEQIYIVLGAIGAGLAFAAREPIANAFSFVQLMMDPPFRIGDVVRIGDFRGGDTVQGEIVGITLSSVTIRSRRLTETSITHSLLWTLRVENLSSADRRRLELTFPIVPGIPAETLRRACLTIEDELLVSEWTSNVRPPKVWISGYSEGLRLKASVWLKRGSDRREAQRDLFLMIHSRFDEIVAEG